MARKTKTITITKDGRDKGKKFVIKEKDAWEIEAWSMQAIQLLARCGVEVPAGIFEHGSAAFLTLGIGAVMTGLGKIPYYDVKRLLDEMNTCIESFSAPGTGVFVSGYDLIRTQIEEASTLFTLREEILSLHLGFSLADYLLSYLNPVTGAMAEIGRNIQTLSGDTADLLQQRSVQDSAP